MVTIYRVEAKDGEGVFQSGLANRVSRALDREPNHPKSHHRHPSPYGDIYLKDWWDQTPYETLVQYYFGFDSIDQLLKWFDCEDVKVKLRELGGRLAIYEVDGEYVKKGHRQTVFRKAHATLKEVREIP